MGVRGQCHPMVALRPGRDPVPTVQEAWWAQGRYEQVGKPRPHRDSIRGPSSP
jgi:hypothetical protein